MKHYFRPAIAAFCMVAVLATTPGYAQGVSGPYLAAKRAFAENDFSNAGQYFTRALMQDPTNTDLMESAVLAFVDQGDFDKAVAISRRLIEKMPDHQIANMVLISKAFLDNDLSLASEMLSDGEAIGPLVDGLALAWVQVSEGDMTSALASFDAVSQQPGLKSFGLFHRALALALVGDFESAEQIMSATGDAQIPVTRNSIISHAQFLSQLERNDEAIALVEQIFGTDLDPGLAILRARLENGETVGFDTVRNGRDGLAEVFFSVAGILSQDSNTNDGYTLIYTRMAEFLRPDHVDATLLAAQLLEQMDQYELATVEYDKIARDDPAFYVAELGRADALRLSGNTDAAIEVLKQLTKSESATASVFVTLGDTYRRLKLYDEAIDAYDSAVAFYDTPQAPQWTLFYSRGIVHERLDQWDKAEADFRKALELRPEQPNVLNYLGYSLVEKQINLDEALDMIERAVSARPNDGYITDSLGWVLYRLGRYSEAVDVMERAGELIAVDPIINDHLGDVYWAVGRRREAEFMWLRAVSFDPEEEDLIRIRRKLEVGLDVVLKDEGADPITFANDG